MQLDEQEGLPMHEIASLLACDSSNVTGIVDRLEARGLVTRRTAERDRRVKHIVPTPAGSRCAMPSAPGWRMCPRGSNVYRREISASFATCSRGLSAAPKPAPSRRLRADHPLKPSPSCEGARAHVRPHRG